MHSCLQVDLSTGTTYGHLCNLWTSTCGQIKFEIYEPVDILYMSTGIPVDILYMSIGIPMDINLWTFEKFNLWTNVTCGQKGHC